MDQSAWLQCCMIEILAACDAPVRAFIFDLTVRNFLENQVGVLSDTKRLMKKIHRTNALYIVVSRLGNYVNCTPN